MTCGKECQLAERNKDRNYQVIIAGDGQARLSTGLYTSRAKSDTLLIKGGLITL